MHERRVRNTRGVSLGHSRFFFFPKPLSCLYQALQTRKTFSVVLTGPKIRRFFSVIVCCIFVISF